MSKFLKVIVNLFLVCAILIAGAILVPPLLGVSTTMVDSSSMDTNLPIGSVTYSQDVSVADISVGDKILVESDTKAYAYIVESADAGAGNYIVTDATNPQADPEEVTLRNIALKIVITVPLIGYIMIAMRSVEGLIIIGLVVLFVIILFILSELWKKTEDDEDEYDDYEDDEEEDDDREEPEEEVVRIARPEKQHTTYAEPTAELTNDELARSIAEIHNRKEEERVEVAAAEPETVQQEAPVQEELDLSEAEVSAADDRNSFVPVARLSKEEILKKAKAAGDDPEVIEYDNFGITIIDFSEDL